MIPEGPGASQEVWRSAPVKGEGRGYEQHFTVYSIYEYSNRETTPVNQIRHTQSVCGREYACRTYRYCRRLWYSVLCGSRIYTSIRISVYMAIHCMHGGACTCCTHSGLYISTTVCIQVCLYSQYGAFSGWAWPGEYETVDMWSAIHYQSAGLVKVATASSWH